MGIKGGKVFLFSAFLPFIFVFFIAPAQAAGPIFSEVCWMGSAESANDEWIELYNPEPSDVDITGWVIRNTSGKLEIFLEGTISAGSSFLLERTDDQSAPEALADFVYSGSLPNDGGTLELYNNDALIDSIVAIDGWPAGDNESKDTMQFSGGLWLTGTPTPGEVNNIFSLPNEELEEEPVTESGVGIREDAGGESEEEETTVSTAKKGKIVLNEIYPNPVGSDRQKEFIELYNAGEIAVDLSGWRLETNGRIYEFGRLDMLYEGQINKVIDPGKYFALFRDRSGLILANSGGTVKLFKPDKKTAEDSLEYGSTIEGYAYADTVHIDLGKINTSTKNFFLYSSKTGLWVWTAQISPGAVNQVKTPNTAPRAIFSAPTNADSKTEIFFDASDTIDEEGDFLEFFWDFGDGVEVELEEARHTFLSPGDYEVVLKASDGREEGIFSHLIRINGIEEKKYLKSLAPDVKDDYWYEESPTFVFPESKAISENVSIMSISEAKLQNGQDVEIEGVASVKPGVIGTQFFYLSDASSGIRVYNYKKDFPPFEQGDLIRARGEIMELRGETTLKISGSEALEIIASGREIPLTDITSEEIVPKNIGRLFRIEGKVLKKSSPRIFLSDGLDEITVYLKAGVDVDIKKIETDTELSVIGILGVISGELALFPRLSDDFQIKKTVIEEDNEEEKMEEPSEKEWTLSARDSKKELLKYFIISLFALGAIVFAYFFQKKRTKP